MTSALHSSRRLRCTLAALKLDVACVLYVGRILHRPGAWPFTFFLVFLFPSPMWPLSPGHGASMVLCPLRDMVLPWCSALAYMVLRLFLVLTAEVYGTFQLVRLIVLTNARLFPRLLFVGNSFFFD